MRDDALEEAIGVLRAMLDAIESTSSERGRAAAELRRTVGALLAQAETLLREARLGTPLVDVCRLATLAGARPQDWRRVILAAEGTRTVHLAAASLALGIGQIALAELVRALQDTAFRSRDEAQAWIARLNPLCNAAIERAADLREASVFRALKALHAAAVRDLTERGRPLARIVRHEFPARRPSLVLAQRLYQDAGRHGELIGENAVVHPAFMPRAIAALSQ